MPRNCCVPQCDNTVVQGKAEHFHKFPKNEKLRKKWIHKLKLGRKPSKCMVVCSQHFKSSDYKLSNYGDNTTLKQGSVPSEKIPKTVLEEKNIIKPTKKRTTKTSARASIGIDVPDVALTDVTMADVSVGTDEQNNADISIGTDEQKADVFTTEAIDSNKFVHGLCAQFDLNSNVQKKDASVSDAPEMKSIGIQTKVPGKRNSYSELSDKDLNYFTGLERERFIILYRMIEKFDPIEDSLLWSKKDALVITLHKCRHNLDFKMMEFIFEVDRRLISETFKEVIHKLYRVLKQIDIWNMSFSDPKSYRCILDCTEFFVVRAGDPNVHQLTFSTYKHHPTFKLLVSCDEKGAVNFIFDAFAGAISDREIVVKSGFLDKLKEYDAILADKGFDISDLLESKGVLSSVQTFRR